MDKDRVKGGLNQAGGQVREKLGQAVERPSLAGKRQAEFSPRTPPEDCGQATGRHPQVVIVNANFEKDTSMDKNAKKKAAAGSKSAKPPSDYKSRETDGKTSQADSKFQKQIGKAKDTLRKG